MRGFPGGRSARADELDLQVPGRVMSRAVSSPASTREPVDTATARLLAARG